MTRSSALLLAAAAAASAGPARTAAALSCAQPDQAPFPYCSTTDHAALSFRPAGAGLPDVLLFLAQTPTADDIVWLDAGDAATEVARCCPRTATGIHQVVGSLAWNDLIDCNGLDTLYAGAITTTPDGIVAGEIYEVSALPCDATTPTSERSCAGGDAGEDGIACGAGADCEFRRVFTFPGAEGLQPQGMAVVDPPGPTPPLLVVSLMNRPFTPTFRRTFFLDPTLPSCTAAEVAVLGSCEIVDGATLVAPTDLAWLGGDLLLAVDAAQDRMYTVAVDFASFSCAVVDSCPATATGLHGLAHDRASGRTFLADVDTNTIAFAAAASAPGGDCCPPARGSRFSVPFFREDPVGTNAPGSWLVLHNPNQASARVRIHLQKPDGTSAGVADRVVLGRGNAEAGSLLQRIRLATLMTSFSQLGNVEVETLGPAGDGAFGEAVTGQLFVLANGDDVNTPSGFVLPGQVEASTTLRADYFHDLRGGGDNFNVSTYLSIHNPDDDGKARVRIEWRDAAGITYAVTEHEVAPNGNAILHTGDSTGPGCPPRSPTTPGLTDGSAVVRALPNDLGEVVPVVGAAVTFDGGECTGADLPVDASEHPRLGVDLRSETRRLELP